MPSIFSCATPDDLSAEFRNLSDRLHKSKSGLLNEGIKLLLEKYKQE